MTDNAQDAFITRLKTILKSCLHQEEIVKIYQAKTTNSIYALLKDGDNYKTLRLSDHDSHQRNTVDSLDADASDSTLKASFLESLYRTDNWHYLTPQSYCYLRLIHLLIPNNYATFRSRNKNGVTFHIVDRHEIEITENNPRYFLNKVAVDQLRRLTNASFITTTGKYNNELAITQSGYAILDEKATDSDFQKEWKKFQKQLNLNDISDNSWLISHKDYKK